MNPSLIKISAVICTYNRSQYIEKALESLLAQSLSKEYFEILVIDNNSSDATAEVVKRYDSSDSHFNYVFEAKLGLSYARNTGLKMAKGEYIAYLDDDAIANKDWLSQILTSFEKNPSYGAIGGRINPIWEVPKPNWLNDTLLPALTIINWSPTPYLIKNRDTYIAGANIAFRKDLLLTLGGFNTALGRIGNTLLSGEETILLEEIRKKGYEILYSPSIEVAHVVPKGRLHKEWFEKRVYWEGVSEYRIKKMSGHPQLLKTVYVAFKLLVKAILYYPIASNDSERFDKKLSARYQLGYLASFFHLV